MRFQTAFSRVRRCEPQFMEQLASKLPLNLTDAAVEEIARPLGWHDSFMKPVSICLAKAPGSGDIGRMLQGGPKAAMPPASAKQTPVAVSATASPPPAPAKASLPAHAKALTPAPILVPPVRATSGPPQPAAPGAPRVPPPPKQASHAAMPTVPSAQPSTPAVAPKAVQTLSKAMPVNPRASPDHVVPPANPPTIEPETVEHAAVEPVVAETPPRIHPLPMQQPDPQPPLQLEQFSRTSKRSKQSQRSLSFPYVSFARTEWITRVLLASAPSPV